MRLPQRAFAHALPWWQELILDWIATWQTIRYLQVEAVADGESLIWECPTDLDYARQDLEALFHQ
jgi:hypothetical protein